MAPDVRRPPRNSGATTLRWLRPALPWLVFLGLSAPLGPTFVPGLVGSPAAEEAAGERLTLHVGKAILWSPGYPSITIVCDDRSLVQVEDAGEKLRLTGLRPGRTRCGFWQSPGLRRVVEIEVLP
jgi:hypothetical protein